MVRDDYKNMKKILVMALYLILALSGFTGAQGNDYVYPSGYSINCNYLLSSDLVAISDTFTISRTLTNNELFDLNGLYFSDNLPSEFLVVDQKVTVNGVPLPFLSIGPIEGHIVDGYGSYSWIIDSRGEAAGVDYSVQPGEIINLELKIVCNSLGKFQLPTHSAVFSGNNTGFFALSDSLEIEVVLSLDVEDDLPGTLPEIALISKAYPNPFNSTVTIKYSGLGIAGNHMTLTLYDLTGRKIFREDFVARENTGYVAWESNESISSGVYLYSLTDGSRNTGGKLILLK
ncbi:MAG: hypothetical protein CVT49_03950 [candidate division Zixibacteria bacterium HGW-Zixibacteria-1]|nr:MAG: hypothetical protein CVT49_03950 [candidate division Zixibacteria bacterium HGW-Zixibacteria-1]